MLKLVKASLYVNVPLMAGVEERIPDDGASRLNSIEIDEVSRYQFGDTAFYTELRTNLYNCYALPPYDFYEKSQRALNLYGHERVLEVGCGTGTFVERIARSGHTGEIFGIDYSGTTYLATELALQEQGFTNVSFLEGDVRSLPFSPASIDAVAANYMLYHVGNPQGAIKEIKRVLIPGGRLVVVTRGDFNMIRQWDLAAKVTRSLGYADPVSPYLNFDAEDAAGLLGQYFEVLPDQSFPGNGSGSGSGTSSLVRSMLIGPEGWGDYSGSIYGVISSSVAQEFKNDHLPLDTNSNIRAAINSIVKPIFDKDIEINGGYFLETAQDKLVTCLNTK